MCHIEQSVEFWRAGKGLLCQFRKQTSAACADILERPFKVSRVPGISDTRITEASVSFAAGIFHQHVYLIRVIHRIVSDDICKQIQIGTVHDYHEIVSFEFTAGYLMCPVCACRDAFLRELLQGRRIYRVAGLFSRYSGGAYGKFRLPARFPDQILHYVFSHRTAAYIAVAQEHYFLHNSNSRYAKTAVANIEVFVRLLQILSEKGLYLIEGNDVRAVIQVCMAGTWNYQKLLVGSLKLLVHVLAEVT